MSIFSHEYNAPIDHVEWKPYIELVCAFVEAKRVRDFVKSDELRKQLNVLQDNLWGDKKYEEMVESDRFLFHPAFYKRSTYWLIRRMRRYKSQIYPHTGWNDYKEAIRAAIVSAREERMLLAQPGRITTNGDEV